jgi:dTMP kinase
MTKRGRLLVVEGLEGAGKSTAILYLQQLLQANGIVFLTTREPGGTAAGESVRQILKHAVEDEPLDPRAELLLFYAARVQLFETVIKPALARGVWVLSDRCELSSFAYQGGGRGLTTEILLQLSEFCVGDTHPDLLFYLDISPEKGLQRAHSRGKLDRIEQESLSFFQKVHAAYQAFLPRYPEVAMIDANQDLATVQIALQHAFEHFMRAQHANA